MVGIFFICSVDFLRRGWEEERSADSLTVSNINIHEAPLTEICLIQTQTHAKLFTHNALQSPAITQIVCHLMRQIKEGQNNIVHCLKRGLLGFESWWWYVSHIVLTKKSFIWFSWSPSLVELVRQAFKCPKTSIKPANQTRLGHHLRLQGHNTPHAAEDDGDELQRIRIHFHIFLACHISCHSGIYINLDFISSLALSVSDFLCISGSLPLCTCQNILFKTKSERWRA